MFYSIHDKGMAFIFFYLGAFLPPPPPPPFSSAAFFSVSSAFYPLILHTIGMQPKYTNAISHDIQIFIALIAYGFLFGVTSVVFLALLSYSFFVYWLCFPKCGKNPLQYYILFRYLMRRSSWMLKYYFFRSHFVVFALLSPHSSRNLLIFIIANS